MKSLSNKRKGESEYPLALAVENFRELRGDRGAQPVCVATGELRLPAESVSVPHAAGLGRARSENHREKRFTLLLLRTSFTAFATIFLPAALIFLATALLFLATTLIFLATLPFLTALILLLLGGRRRRRSYSSIAPAPTTGVLGVVIISSAIPAGGYLGSKFLKVSLVRREPKLHK